MPFQSEGLFAFPSRKGVKGWRAEKKKRVFQALVFKSLALRGMERVVGINRMLGGRVEGRERAVLGSPRESVLASVLCLFGGARA